LSSEVLNSLAMHAGGSVISIAPNPQQNQQRTHRNAGGGEGDSQISQKALHRRSITDEAKKTPIETGKLCRN
jgi:hypothetical protein